MHPILSRSLSDGAFVNEFYATEKLIGGLILVGVGSLLVWNADQTAGSSAFDLVFRIAVIVGAVMATIGLFELFTGHRFHADRE